MAHIETDIIQRVNKKSNLLAELSLLQPFWFYPEAFYPHKNHTFLIELANKIKKEGRGLIDNRI